MKKNIRLSLLGVATLAALFIGSGITHATYSKIPCVVTPNFQSQTANDGRGPSELIIVYLRWSIGFLKHPEHADRPYYKELQDAVIDARNHYCARTGNEITTVPEIITALAPYMPTVESFIADKILITPGQSSTLSWASVRANKCTIEGMGDVSTSGTKVVSPTTTTTYSMMCSTPDFTSTPKTVTVTVQASETISSPVISSFSASPANIISGQSSTLSWASTNADKCTIGGIGDVSTSGTKVVSPTNTTTYDMTCYKGTTASNARTTTVTVAGTSSSGSTSENPYAGSLSNAAKNTINTWITKNIKSRSATLSTENYTKFVESIITKLNQIKATTPASNVNKINLINYIVWELQDIVSNAFLEGLFS